MYKSLKTLLEQVCFNLRLAVEHREFVNKTYNVALRGNCFRENEFNLVQFF